MSYLNIFMSICGIYKITNKINNKKYIGQSIRVKERIAEHKNQLKNNTHHNQYLQNAYNKYGEQNFSYQIICECERDELNDKEIFYIHKYDSFINGYNLTPGGSFNYTKQIENKIAQYDNQHDIQHLLLSGKKIYEIANDIPCNKQEVKIYCRNHNIIKPISSYNNRETTNTGVRYLTLLSTGVWQYRRTHQNPNNITRTSYIDIKKTIQNKGYLWIVDDIDKLTYAKKKAKLNRTIFINKKKGSKIAKRRKDERHKQKFLQKRALKAFRKMFAQYNQIIKNKSPTGVTHLRFSKGDNSWVFRKPKQKSTIKRQKLLDLYNEVTQQGYDWIIENKDLFHNVIKEVKKYQEERKKPFSQRKTLNLNFI